MLDACSPGCSASKAPARVHETDDRLRSMIAYLHTYMYLMYAMLLNVIVFSLKVRIAFNGLSSMA